MKKISKFGIVFIVLCVIIVFALPAYVVINNKEITETISGWIDENLNSNSKAIQFQVSIDLSSKDYGSDLPSMRDVYNITLLRDEGRIKISKILSVNLATNERITYEDEPRYVYYADFSGDTVHIAYVDSDNNIKSYDVGDSVFAETIRSAFAPDDVSAFTEFKLAFDDITFSGPTFSSGAYDVKKYCVVPSKYFTSPFESLCPLKVPDEKIKVHYSYSQTEGTSEFSVMLYVEEQSDIRNVFEYIYNAVTGLDYSNYITENHEEYNLQIYITFYDDMYDVEFFKLPLE